MIRRRTFLSASLAGAALPMNPMVLGNEDGRWYMPDEGAPHDRTWMAFGASRRIWGGRLLPEVRRNLGLIADTISQFEPVSMLVREDEMAIARKSIRSADVELMPCPLDDLWLRDTAPLFVIDGAGNKAAVGFNFNGWGRKQAHTKDARVAAFIAKQAGVPFIKADLTMEGGCIEQDGEGTGIATESCILIKNRNPGWSKAEVEDELADLLGIEKMIWLPGVSEIDITDGHTDFYARFVRPGVVVAWYDPNPNSPDHQATKEHLEILRKAKDLEGRNFDVIVLESPKTVRPRYNGADFAAGYVGFYVCNGAVILQEFGDQKADARAEAKLREAFPGRKMVAIAIDGIAAGGGSVHCATQQEPSA